MCRAPAPASQGWEEAGFGAERQQFNNQPKYELLSSCTERQELISTITSTQLSATTENGHKHSWSLVMKSHTLLKFWGYIHNWR